ncbi:MAG: hypothetical protein P4L10_03685 [Acidobacteriaceae bacterium]|jgi:hypothetical protein|nr:hypothetical protein [Acidobacteriaceae bacterium]
MSFENLIAEIDSEISRLTQARQLLTGGAVATAKRGPGRPPAAVVAAKPKKKRKMSVAGKARIAAAQKARWAKVAAAKTAKPEAKAVKSTKTAKAK